MVWQGNNSSIIIKTHTEKDSFFGFEHLLLKLQISFYGQVPKKRSTKSICYLLWEIVCMCFDGKKLLQNCTLNENTYCYWLLLNNKSEEKWGMGNFG